MPTPEAIAIAAATKIVEKAAPGALTRISKRISKSADKIKILFTETFQGHLEASHFRARWVKTIVSKDRPIDISTIYVGLFLSDDEDETISDIDINPSDYDGARFIVSGTGGAGKTILMKHLTGPH